ncbi:MAG: WD40/YVTN/BNR-like repeat-containing protein, partial [Candidatus Hodarchaeales archaeon]
MACTTPNRCKKHIMTAITIVALISLLSPISLKMLDIYSVYGVNQAEEVANWTVVDTEYSARDTKFNDIDFLNRTHGWIVGQNSSGSSGGIVLHTSDGGISWNLQYYNVSHVFKRVEIINETVIWINGYGSLFFTSDMGNTWKEKPIVDGRSGLAFVDFLNETHGWTGTSKKLFSTKDGGKSWINDSSWTFSDTPRDLEFVDS